MQDSIFTRIIKGEIPCHKIYEDDQVVAFLDIHPLNPGHVLLVPKKQVENLWDLEDDDYHYLWSVAKHLAGHIQKTLKPLKVGSMVEGLEVPHAHIHLIPLYKAGDMNKGQDLEAEPDHTALAETAKRLAL